ncbi:MAG: VTT domain-containing protein [Methylomonas sp.]|nr:VTT domain-containing protein [Methylomonas sp.]PPD20411.1 MAG: hypothetical protein CTY23_09040 [Methylomonas sp.]PPD25668.1 MAG: hypothetical protein CTY22_07710 [Methylomonas sp.]PPD36645.1 MAG: hypothetical protein CTY21_07710 [Methylomonas sp.]PPD40562.1 MAG: hypothetical protein CTY17_06155 [Methylomonas sp.]
MLKENLVKTLIGLLLLMVLMAALGYGFEDPMYQATHWVIERIGFVGLCLIMFVTDTLITPFSPDILLVMVAHSDLAAYWQFYVPILGLVSVMAGLAGWCIGRWLANFDRVRSLIDSLADEQRRFLQDYGFWAIALAAVTPLPYSLVCWAAGAMPIRWTTVLTASLLFRIPRMIIFYLVIASAGDVFA